MELPPHTRPRTHFGCVEFFSYQGQFGGLKQELVPAALFGIAVLMLIPIVMVVVSVMLTGQTLRWISVIVAVGFFVFNVIGLPTYSGLYDKFLIVVGLGWNATTAWYAWTSLSVGGRRDH